MSTTTDELRAAASRLVGHVAARTDGEDPYRLATPDDPAMSHTFDHDRFTADIGAVGRAYLAEHPADDGEPVTPEWLAATGFSPAWGDKYRHQRGHMDVVWREGVMSLAHRTDEWSELPVRTRGHVRRLLMALGITPEVTK